MKITRFLVFLASSCVLLASPPPPAFAQTPYADSSGNIREDNALNLAGPRIYNVLPPAHLGTGTPSSTTVLRGDGSWVGTTPTGATVAATGNLLQGDGAGNAVPISSTADLARVLQLRADTARMFSALPVNLLGSANLVIRAGTVNADGTLTIPANDYVQWSQPPLDTRDDGGSDHTVHSCYAVATTDQPVGSSGGSTGFFIVAWYSGYGFYGGSFDGAVSSAPAPGVSKLVFTNNVGNGQYLVAIVNKTSAPITIYPPVLSKANDAGLLPVPDFVDTVAVASQPVADLDFTRFASSDRTPRYLAERLTTLAADSVNGSDAGAGTLYAPKLTLQQTVSNGSVFGLYRGSLFRDSLPLSTLGNTRGVVVQDIALGSEKPLPIISALDPVTAFTNNGGDGTYSCFWTPTDANIANDTYQNVYVVEIDATTETATPVAARHRMIDVSGASAVATTPGSVWVQPPGTGAGQSGTTQWKATLRPTSVNTGSAGPPVGGYPDPGNGWYRYEVVSRYAPANWGAPNNLGDGALGGVELIGGSWGYGSLGSPVNFVGDRLVILHGTTHDAVIGGGGLQRSVFYEGGDDDSIMLAWYSGTVTGLRWDLRQCLFYNNVGDRNRDMVIAHSAGSTNYERGDISDCAFLGARWSDGSLHGVAFKYDNVLTGTINRVYVQGVRQVFGSATPVSAEVKNSVFRQIAASGIGCNFHDNLVLAESAGVDYASPQACSLSQAGASAMHNLFVAQGIANGFANNDQASGVSIPFNNCACARNIIVMAPVSATAPAFYMNIGSADLTTLNVDYNLVVNLAKGGFAAQGNHFSWADYQAAYSTLDPHSMYLDLSADPRGLNAVFADPANGDFRWAQTDVARRCAAYCQANHVGPAAVTSRWPVVPTVDEAVRSLTNL